MRLQWYFDIFPKRIVPHVLAVLCLAGKKWNDILRFYWMDPKDTKRKIRLRRPQLSSLLAEAGYLWQLLP
jgi:hypothetical protein